MGRQAVAEEPVSLRVYLLGKDVRLVACDRLAPGTDGPVRLLDADAPVRPPLSRTRLRLTTGGEREIFVFRGAGEQAARARDAAGVRIEDRRGRALATGAASRWAGIADADVLELTDGLSSGGRIRLARSLFLTWAGLFRLGGDRQFLSLCRGFLRELVGRPGSLAPACEVAGQGLLFEGQCGGWLGERPSAVLLTPRGLRRVPVPLDCEDDPASPDGRTLVRLLLHADEARTAQVVILGEQGIAWRVLAPPGRRLPGALEWLGGAGGQRPAARRYVMDVLAARAAEEPRAGGVLRELRALLPGPATRLAAGHLPLAAGADVIVGCAGGVFVSGWLDDPFGVVEGIRIERAGRCQDVAVRDLGRFAHPSAPSVRSGAGDPGAQGFVLFAGVAMNGPAQAPCGVALRLGSGGLLRVAEGPTPRHAATAHEAVLAAVPGPWLTDDVVARCLEPAVRGLGPRCATLERQLEIGSVSRSPRASLVVTLGDDPDHVRCRYGLLAGDPIMGEVELIHILDRPDRCLGARRLLEGLEVLYGVGTRLLVLAGPADGPAALDAAATMATAEVVMFLGAGVVPQRRGWLRPFLSRLGLRRQCGAVGARIIHADGSLCHAGGEVELTGTPLRLEPKIPLQGFPAGYAADWSARQMPIVPAGAFAIRRAALEEAGGLPAGYLQTELAVADVCLALRARGLENWMLGTPTLVDLAPAAAAAGLDPARELDRRRLERRWRDRLAVIGAAEPASADAVSAVGGQGVALWTAA